MSRTYKDKPYSLGGSRHKWYTADNHNSHGKFTRLMSRLARRELDRSVSNGELIKKSKFGYYYFD